MPQDIEAESELRNLAAVQYQIVSPANNSPIIGIFQDSLLGCNRFTREGISFDARHAMNLLMMFNRVNENELQTILEQDKPITNFDLLTQIMSPISLKYKTKLFKDDEEEKGSNNVLEIRDGQYIRGQLEKGTLGGGTKGLLQRVCNDYGNRACADFIDNLQNIITEYMKTSSYSVGISDLIAPKSVNQKIVDVITEKKKEVKNIIDQTLLGVFENKTGRSNEEEFETQVNNILNQASAEVGKVGLKSLGKDNRFVTMVNAGSKGSDLNISFMISCLGQQNVDGKRIPYGFDHRTLPHFTKYDDSPGARGFVESSYINGLSPQELFFHAMGGRVGLIDTAVKSVTWETPIVVIQDKKPLYTEIGRWIDGQLDNESNRSEVQHFTERNMELLDIEEGRIFVPTTDEDGKVTWGPIVAITRHDPGTELYEIKTQGGRTVTVTESKSLLVWNPETKKMLEKPTPDIRVGECVPVTQELCAPPVIIVETEDGILLDKEFGIYLGKELAYQNDSKDAYIPSYTFFAPIEFIKSVTWGFSKNQKREYKSKRLLEGISMLLTRIGSYSTIEQNESGLYNLVIMQKESYKSYNNVALDPIVEINIIDTKAHPKVYDLTIPETFNFGLANGLQVRDTSSTGYIQRRLIKGLEDLMVSYDMTVRTNKNKIVQFTYGDDGIDPVKVENQMCPIVTMGIQDIYAHFQLPSDKENTKLLSSVFLKPVVTRHKKQLPDWQARCKNITDYILSNRDKIVQNIFKNKGDIVVNSPVAFAYIIGNVQGQQNLTLNSMVDLTLWEAMQMIDTTYSNLEKIRCAVPTELFKTLYYYHLAPKELLIVKRFHRAALTVLLETITMMYKRAIVAPGEMVGMIAAQSIGEPTTQLTLNSFTYETELLVRDRQGTIQTVQIGDFVEKYIAMPKRIEYYADQDTTYAELGDYYEIPSCTEDGEIVWKEIEAVTRHPVINEDGSNTMLRVTTKEEREVNATKAKSFLKLVDGKIIPVTGDSLKVGDYLPVSTKQLDYIENKELDLRTILPPTEYIYASEIEKAKQVMHEYHWWSKHSGSTFVLPYSRSDIFVSRVSEKIRNNAKTKTEFKQDCVYMLQNAQNVCTIPEKIPLDYDFGYLVGAYAAEGCMTKFQCSISNNDTTYFEPIVRLCERWNITTKVFRHENKCQEGWTSQDIRLYCTLLCRILEKLCGKLSHNKFVHDTIVFSNKECILGFLDAYIGGDGTVDKRGKYISMSSVSKRMLVDVQVMLNTLNIYSYIKSSKKQESNNRGTKPENIHQMYTLYVTNYQAYKLAGLLNIKLQYKQDNLLILLENDYKYEINRQYVTVPNEIDGVIHWEPRTDDNCRDVLFDCIKSIEEIPNTTNYAFDLTIKDTKNFVAKNGLGLRDTFHMAGVSSKSNVTRGVPRIEEILSLSSEPKNPSLTVYLKPEEEMEREKAQRIMYLLEHTKMAELVSSTEICFDPDDLNTMIAEDATTMEQYRAFESMVDECLNQVDPDTNEKSKWILRMEMNPEVMLEKNISMDDVHFTIQNTYGNDISCIYTDYNADKLVFRIRMNSVLKQNSKGQQAKKAKMNPLDQSDQIYLLKNFQDQLLENIVIRGIKKIGKVILRKIKDNVTEVNGSYKKQDIWVLDTIGSNLLDILAIDFIDANRTFSNDIVEIYEVLGIEAARQTIQNELAEVIEFDGTYINYHHLSVLCDRMTFTNKMISIFRHGINNDNIGPIAKASFEETPEMFLKAARHAELDTMRGVSANVMCGQEGLFGTNAFQVVLDLEEMRKLEEVILGEQTSVEDSIEKQFGDVENPNDPCSTNALVIQNNVTAIKTKDLGQDTDYTLDF
jgi:DNA-directed RNA polymerase beta' subunit